MIPPAHLIARGGALLTIASTIHRVLRLLSLDADASGASNCFRARS
jgi:hypothetical protein